MYGIAETVAVVIVSSEGGLGSERTGGTSCYPINGWVSILELTVVQGLPRAEAWGRKLLAQSQCPLYPGVVGGAFLWITVATIAALAHSHSSTHWRPGRGRETL